MASSTINLKALGLNFSPNALELPPGSLIEANNVIIRRDNVIESRRGYKLFGEEIPQVSGNPQFAKQLAIYRQRILRHYGSVLAYQDGVLNNGNVNFTEFSGDFPEVEAGLRIKSIQSKNGNFYFTTKNGIQKISVSDSADFNTATVAPAGGIKALDLQSTLNLSLGDQESFLPENSVVAYKLVWGKIDNNNVEILGTPSEQAVLYNPLKTLLQTDFNRLLNILDNFSSSNSLITDGTTVNTYSSLMVSKDTNAVDLRSKMIDLAKKIDEDLVFATDAGSGGAYSPLNMNLSGTITNASVANPTVITSNGHGLSNGQSIYVNITNSTPIISGVYVVSNVTINTFTIPVNVTVAGTAGSWRAVYASSGLMTVNYSAGTASNYFAVGDKIFLTNFKSNGIDVDNINGAQTVASVSPFTFIARDYAVSNSVGVSGAIASFTGTAGAGVVTVTTPVNHGLKTNQKIALINTGDSDLDGIRTITVKTPTSFDVNVNTVVTAGTTGVWSIILDQVGEIQSNKYRSITTPLEIVAAEDTGIIDVRGTGAQLFSQQTYLNTIVSLLKSETNFVINTAFSISIGLAASSSTNLGFTLTKNASSKLTFTVPHNIDSSYYYKLYRTATLRVTAGYSSPLEDQAPPNQYSLALQQYYDSSLLSIDKTITIVDNVPSSFLEKENLYTNSDTSGGQEIKPNDYPPFAHDINTFKGYTFYANTKLKQTKDLELLGVAKLKDELSAVPSRLPKVLISDGTAFNNCEISFVRGVKQIATIAVPGSAIPNILPKTFPNTNVDISTNTITTTIAHGFSDGYVVKFSSTGTLPSPLNSTTDYYIISSTLTTFQLSLTNGGPAIDLTSQGSGTHTVVYVSKYFDINSATGINKYRIWFDLTGSDVAPDAASRQLVKVYIPSNTQNDVGQKIKDTLNVFVNDFSSSFTLPTITINYLNDGVADLISFGAGMTNFVPGIFTSGVGESVANKTAIIPSDDSLLSAVATAETTKSFIRVLNRNTAKQNDLPSPGFDTYAYYSNSNPGIFLLEGTAFIDKPYYLSTNNATVGASFSPSISPLNTTGTTITSPSVGVVRLQFSSNHNLLNNDIIVLTNTNSNPTIDGVYQVNYINSTTLDISKTVTFISPGTSFSFSNGKLAEFSDNYTRKNRIYYSKFEQPEAVSLNVLTGNFETVGSEDAAILRIFPLRDSLFIFKEDGLFRLSAETEPFTVALFDSSCILNAPDSVAVSQNLIYSWTTQGISTISESGVAIASRPIDTEVLKLQSANYPDFKTATFGIGYESDNSYLVWTVTNPQDQYATQAFRYSSLTGTWTKYTKINSCGVLNPADDKLYLGLPNLSFLEQERKLFDRTDYSDYEFNYTISTSNYFGNVIKLPNVSDLKVGDVFTQIQGLTVYQFNSLLKKLDTDPGLGFNDYYSALFAIGGDNLRSKIVSLAQKLDLDPSNPGSGGFTDYASTIGTKSGTITNVSLSNPTVLTDIGHGLFDDRVIIISNADTIEDINGNHSITKINNDKFSIPINVYSYNTIPVISWATKDEDVSDVLACFNKIIEKLNTDPKTAYNNYLPIVTNSLLETVIIDIDYVFKKLTLNKTLDFVQGTAIVYSAIECSIVYSPNTFGDPLSLKHVREATVMFANKAFTSVSLGFSSDLLPAFEFIDFNGNGSGLFGNDVFGGNFFGGVSHSAPIRTIIPKNAQRCRYLNVSFTHQVAREQFALYGITLTGKLTSTRAYR